MEEDIKNVERVIEYIQLESPIVQGLGNAIYTDSLKRLIKGYRELQKEADILMGQNEWYKDYYDCESIPKSKIKEKIEPVIDSLEKDGFVGYADELRDIMSELMEDK